LPFIFQVVVLVPVKAVSDVPQTPVAHVEPAVHAPDWQVSLLSHGLPSLQLMPSVALGFVQNPVAVLHVPATWHWSSAVHVTKLVPVQVPPWHDDDSVHAFALLHTVPFVLGAQTPSVPPVRAALHAKHVLVQATLQQTPSTQAFDAHCPLLVQVSPFGFSMQSPALQSPVWQSAETPHATPTLQVSPKPSHSTPPQSTPVSSASFTPSVQWLATQLPLPSHTTSPPAPVHAVPTAAGLTPQQPAVQVFVRHGVVCAAHVDGCAHEVDPRHVAASFPPSSCVPASPTRPST
jgi:hypothetical protein